MLEQQTGVYDNPYKFNAKELDRETGLYYYGARYYNPRASIWYGVDPLAVYNPVMETQFYGDGEHNGGVFYWGNLNPYIYTYQNPIKYVDPNGKQTLSYNIYGDNPQTRSQVAGEYLELSKNINMASFALVDTFLTRGLGTKIMIAYASGEAAHSMQMQTHWRDRGNEAQAKKYEKEGAEATKELVVFGGLSLAGNIGGRFMSPSSLLCFVKGTLVSTNNGLIPIEEIRIGDMVWSYNESEHEIELKKVVTLSTNEASSILDIKVDNEIIQCTPNHPFYVNGKWVEAGHLKIGDKLFLIDGSEVTIQSVILRNNSAKVYNFEVEDNHNYYVSKYKILVHNTCWREIATIYELREEYKCEKS
jgi:RHS repeat-associated protein